MADVSELLAAMRKEPQNVRFADACKVADHYFGEPRQNATSHRVWKMPWPGNPRVNMQDDGGKAKRYQVDQLIAAIDHCEQLARRAEEARAKAEADAEAEKKSKRKKKGKQS